MTDFEKYINEIGDKASKAVNDGIKIFKDVTAEQTQKVKIRSEIGQNQRDITKAYAKLGEAYYDAKENHTEMSGVNDLVDLIRSKKKLIELLSEKLEALEAEEE